jgi:group I intron endonuclease
VQDTGVVGLGNMALVYKITNSITNKCYIGYTSKSVNDRWAQHIRRSYKGNSNCKFDNALKKYDVTNWTVEILEENLSASESKEREVYYIQLYDSYNNGYNSTLGGDGNNGIIMTEESNKKRSDSLKGKQKNYDRMHGKLHKEESKLKISEAHRGMKKPWVKWSSEQINKRALTRRSLTLEMYNQLQELKSQGYTRKQISEKLQVSFDVVKKWTNRPWDL